MKTLGPYKGYIGNYEADFDNEILYGSIQGISGYIEYTGKTVQELKTEFQASVDAYLEMCEESGVQPEKPFSSSILLRIQPDIHRDIYLNASKEHKSKNQYIIDAITFYMHGDLHMSMHQTKDASIAQDIGEIIQYSSSFITTHKNENTQAHYTIRQQ